MRDLIKFTICVCCLTATDLHAQSQADTAPNVLAQIQVAAKRIDVRAQPDLDSIVVATLERAQLADVVGQRGEWIEIRLAARGTGWILRGLDEYQQTNVEPVTGKNAARPVSGQPNESDIEVRRPGHAARVVTLPPIDPDQVAPPMPNLPRDSIPIPDRWRLMQALGFKFPLYDPYNQNPLKGDLPVLTEFGEDLFFSLGVVSDTLVEARRLPTPVASQVSPQPGSNDVFGRNRQNAFSQNLIISVELTKGDTTFRPPDYEFRFVPVLNYNRTNVSEVGVLNINPAYGDQRVNNFFGVQELFVDTHLRNVDERYDFDSVRVGIQPFNVDFRGFLFQDTPFGVRLFGNRSNNLIQYNLAWFRRLEKDTDSGLNDVGRTWRNDDVFVVNAYHQDWPVEGMTTQISLVHNRNNEKQFYYDTDGFLVRPALAGDVTPHSYQVTYPGVNLDGHVGVWNLSASAYGAFGTDEHNPIAQRAQQIEAGFFATELSRDVDWMRFRFNALVASGDKNPVSGKATGFDAILDNPQFAGSGTSFFIRQALPLIGGGGVSLTGGNSIFPSLRSSEAQGQSNFVNPGLGLLGAGADFDVLPELRIFTNISSLRFMNTSSLELLRSQPISSNSIGTDWSAGFHWRPFLTQNLVINGSVAVLKSGAGLKELYGNNQGTYYSALLNAVLTF